MGLIEVRGEIGFLEIIRWEIGIWESQSKKEKGNFDTEVFEINML